MSDATGGLTAPIVRTNEPAIKAPKVTGIIGNPDQHCGNDDAAKNNGQRTSVDPAAVTLGRLPGTER
jgi:hypothetical protein